MSTLKVQIWVFSSILCLSSVLKAKELESDSSRIESYWVDPYLVGFLVNFADGFLARQALAGSTLCLLNAKNRVWGESTFALPSAAVRALLVAIHSINLLGSLERIAVPELGLDIDRWNPQRLLFALFPESLRRSASNLVEALFGEYSKGEEFQRGKKDYGLAIEALNVVASAMALYHNIPALLPSDSGKLPVRKPLVSFSDAEPTIIPAADEGQLVVFHGQNIGLPDEPENSLDTGASWRDVLLKVQHLGQVRVLRGRALKVGETDMGILVRVPEKSYNVFFVSRAPGTLRELARFFRPYWSPTSHQLEELPDAPASNLILAAPPQPQGQLVVFQGKDIRPQLQFNPAIPRPLLVDWKALWRERWTFVPRRPLMRFLASAPIVEPATERPALLAQTGLEGLD